MKTSSASLLMLGPVIALSSALISPAVNAQSVLITSGSSTLANTFQTSSGPEAITVSWFVVENTSSGVYTYGYNVNNPAGDVLLNNNYTPTTTPEVVDSFSVNFNTTVPGAYLSGTEPVGGTLANSGTAGLLWIFPDVMPGNSSPLLAFQSDLAPTMGNASADGGSPPAPWASMPDGQQVPIPDPILAVHEPTTKALLAFAAFGAIPLGPKVGRFLRRK